MDWIKRQEEQEQVDGGRTERSLHKLAACGLLLLSLVVLLFLTRNKWLHLVEDAVFGVLGRISTRFRRHEEAYSFLADSEAGLSSETFSLSSNINSADSRQGLDVDAKRAIQRIMTSEGLSFDEARAKYTRERMQQHDILPDGRPNDPKAVFFS